MTNDSSEQDGRSRTWLDRRRFLGLSSAGLATGLAGCAGGGGGNGGDGTPTPTSGGDGTPTATPIGSRQEIINQFDIEPVDYADQIEDELVILQWSAYWPTYYVPNFEKIYDVDVKVSFFNSNEAMFNKLKALGPGQVDLIFPSDFMVNIMATQGMLGTLNLDKIPNYGNLKDSFEEVRYEPDDASGTYSMPFNWGWSAMGNNTEVTGGSLDPTWEEMFSEENKGNVTMLNNMRESIGAALLYLGYSVNETDEDKINEARDLLIEQKEKGIVKAYDSSNVQSLLTNGEASPCHSWNGQTFGAYRNLMDDNNEAPVEFVIPEEGNIIWTDAAVLDKEAPHPNAAHAFLNYTNNVKVHADLTDWLIYPTILEGEKEHREAKWVFEKLDGFTPTSEQLGRMEYIENVGDATQHYSEAWTEIKNA